MMYKIVIQARLGSTRLKNKMIRPFYDELTLIEVIITNLLKGFKSSDIILATSESIENKLLGEYANKLGIETYYGSENDVLSRFIDICDNENLDFVIRICADNPFIQNSEIKRLIDEYDNDDYISFFYSDNTPAMKSHSGFFTELVKTESLRKVKELTTNEFYFEHVTNYIYENEKTFRVKKLKIDNEEKIKSIRLTIDNEEDFNLSKDIYKRYIENKSFLTYFDIANNIVTSEEKIKMINQINKNIK